MDAYKHDYADTSNSNRIIMELYESKTKKELIDIINQLEKQVEQLSSHLNIERNAKKAVKKTVEGNADILRSVQYERILTHEEEVTEAPSFSYDTLYLNSTSDNQLPEIEELRRINLLLNVVLNNVPVYLFMKDAKNDFKYVYFNKTFADYSGITPEEAIGRSDFEIFPNATDVERFHRDDLHVLRVGRVEFTEEYTTKNGEERMTKTVKSVVKSSEGHPYIIGMSWDMTDIMQMKKELISSRIKAEESDRLKSAFLSNMTHEIRTPLNAIVGFSHLIVDSELKSEQNQYADIIEKNSNVLLNLFNDILDLSALETGTLDLAVRMIRVKDVGDQLFKQFKDNVQPNVELILDPMDENLCMEGDWKRIMQIGGHLLSNAVKFTSSGTINFGFSKKRDMIQFYVRDTGVGISPKRSATIFLRFDKGDKFVQGSGLGLPICRMLVEKMGGQIWVQSKLSKGSTFFFTLPINAKQILL